MLPSHSFTKYSLRSQNYTLAGWESPAGGAVHSVVDQTKWVSMVEYAGSMIKIHLVNAERQINDYT